MYGIHYNISRSVGVLGAHKRYGAAKCLASLIFTSLLTSSVSLANSTVSTTPNTRLSDARVAEATRIQPSIDRGLVALPASAPHKGVYLSWRLFADDAPDIGFNVYRVTATGKPELVNTVPIVKTSDFVDESVASLAGASKWSWFIRPVTKGVEGPKSIYVKLPQNPNQPFISINTHVDTHTRALAVGDLLGRGQLDFVTRYSSSTIDPHHSLWRPSKGTYKLQAVDRSGKKLWTYDMGDSIEKGIWYSPYLIYDLDQDGDAELIVKAGDETWTRERMRDSTGRVRYGPEYLRIIDGHDGKTVLAQADWPNRQGFRGADSDDKPKKKKKFEDYNRQSRHQMAIAYLDGKTPHVIVLRGTYGKLKVHAYKYAKKTLTKVWTWENEDPYQLQTKEAIRYRAREFTKQDPEYRVFRRQFDKVEKWWGQGAHSIRIADVDEDGKDEVILGAIALDDNGESLWSLSRGHVDHIYVADLIPNRPGLEVYYGTERGHDAGGMGMADARTGKVLWKNEWKTRHIHREGLCADVDPNIVGVECYSGEYDKSKVWMWSANGKVLSKQFLGSLNPLAVYWDNDYQKEVFLPGSRKQRHQRTLGKIYDYSVIKSSESVKELASSVDVLKSPKNTEKNDLQYIKVLAVMDILGDWREEIIAVDRGKLLIYMSRIPAKRRHHWLMQDPIYRHGVTVGSMGYYQQPSTSVDYQSYYGL